MKRKLWVLFATIVAAVALAFGISACSPFVQLPTQPQPLGTPVVSISDEGIASWEPVVHAVGYSYLIDDAAEVSTTARNVQLEDGQTIQVKATGDGSLYLDSAYSTPATYHKEPVPELTQLATPVVSIDEEGLATWEAVPNASGYQYKLNGGEENTLKSDDELQVQLQDKDSIQVKAVGDGETYSDSEYSEAKAYTAPVKPQIIKIETPVVTIDGDGTAHWEAVAHASAYFYKIDGEDEIRTTKTSTKLQDGQTISVKACTEEEGYEDSDYSEPVKYTAPVTPPQPTQLATPEVTINEEGLATWTEVAHASGYKYKISGGEETTLVGAELQVQLEDKQSIEVKAVGDGETYSDSPYSAAKTYNAPAKPEPTQLATPEVTINEAGLATWTEVAHASGYKYKINGGEEKTLVGAELQVQLEDKQYIEVKAVGDGETYSDSPYSAAKTYNAPVKPEPTQLATPEVTIDEAGLATWERVENATGYVCKVGGEEQEVQTELSIQLQSGDTLQVKAVSTDTEHFTESAYSDLQTYTKQPVEEKEKLLATFTLGKDTDQTETKDGADNAEADGDKTASDSYEEGPVNGYTLKITASVKDPEERLFLNAWDNKGNGCLKLGGGSGKTGKITVEVPAGVTKVIFYIAGYKSNNAVIKINGSTETITITTHSADGSYTQVVAEVPESRKVTLETSGSKTSRCKINTIEFWGEAVPELTKLDAPTLNVDSHTGDVTWEKVAGATSYTYTIDGENETTVGKDDELKVTLKNNQTITVIAKGDGTTYADSDPATQKYVHEHAYKTENNGWENDSDEGHYKKCTYCQEETEKIGHTYENGVCTECQYAHTDHKYSAEKPGECTVCHLKHTEHTYEDRNGKCHTCFAEHTGDDHVLATKTSSTHHWTECEVCGARTAEIAHTHNTYGSDETQHWSVCECGATVPDTTVQHSKNTTYTDDPTNHWDVCICGKEVPGTKIAHTHDHYDIQEETHQSVCACGAKFGEAEKHDSAGWGKDLNNHWTICSVCGGNEGEHTAHEFKAEGDASEETCECGMEKNHVHTLEWQSNETEHWQKCKYCTHVQDQEAHDYVNGVCSNENCRHEHGGETHKLTLHSNPTHHWNECDICHLKEGETAHSEFTWQLGTDDKEGKHQHICGVCKQVADEHDAQEGAWDHDGTDHWHKCAGADDCTLPFDAKTPHGDFAWESVDDTYHQQKCKCGYTTNKVNHGEAYQWKETEDGSQHYQHCETCGHDTEKAAHSYEEKDYIADGDTGHYRVCECGHHEETEGHNYNKETGDGICTKCDHEHTGHTYNKEAKDGKCKTCGKEHTHDFGSTYQQTEDGSQHYQVCACGKETTPEEHTYDQPNDECVCGKVNPDAEKIAAALAEINGKLTGSTLTDDIVLDATKLEGVTVEITCKPAGAVTYDEETHTIKINKYLTEITGQDKDEKTVKQPAVKPTFSFTVSCGTATPKSTDEKAMTIACEVQGDAHLAYVNFLSETYNPKGGSWSSDRIDSYALDLNITAHASDGSNNGKYYSGWRFYHSDSGELTFTVAENPYGTKATIHSIAITFKDKDSGTLLCGENKYTSEAVIVYFDGIKFAVGGASNGKITIESITIVYSGGISQEEIDEQNAQEVLGKIELNETTFSQLSDIGRPIDLPNPTEHSAKVTWGIDGDTSEYVTVQGTTLKITALPAKGSNDQTVTLTVTVKVGTFTTEAKTFEITLKEFDYETYLKGVISVNVSGMPEELIIGKNEAFTFTIAEEENVKFTVTCTDDALITVTPKENGQYLVEWELEVGTHVDITITATYGEIEWATGEAVYPFDVKAPSKTEIDNLLEEAYGKLEGMPASEMLEGTNTTIKLPDDSRYSEILLEVALAEGENSGAVEVEESGLTYTVKASKAGQSKITITLSYMGDVQDYDDVVTYGQTIPITVVSATQADDAKISNAYESISETITVDRKGEKDLNPAGKDTDVTLKWSYVGEANSTYPLTEAGLLTVNRLPDEALDLNLQVEISCGKGTPKTKNVTVKLEALNVSDFLDEAIGQVQVDEKLTAAEEGELKEGSYTITLPSTAEGTYFAGITFEVNSTNNTAVQIAIDGVNVTLTVTRQEEPTPITLTIKATYKGAPKESTYSFNVPAIERWEVKDITFDSNKQGYTSGETLSSPTWQNDEGEISITFTSDAVYNSNEGSIKVYSKKYFTVACIEGKAKNITKIILTFGSGDATKNVITTDKGSYSESGTGVWTADDSETTSVKFTNTGSGQRRVATIQVFFEGKPLTAAQKQEKLATAKEELTIEPTELTQNLELPTLDGFNITWAVTEGGANANVVDNKTLEITRPEEGADDAKVKLVATIELNGETTTKEFDLVVKAQSAQGGGDTKEEKTVTWTASSSNKSGGTVDDITISFEKDKGSNAPSWNNSDNALRVYWGYYIKVTASSGYTISKIEITAKSGSNTLEADEGSYTDNAWTGSAPSVKLLVTGTSGHCKLQKIVITYATN